MLESPVYLLLVVGTVVTGYLVNRLLEFLRRRELLQVELTKLVDEAAGRQPVAGARPLSPYSVLQLFDAIGLAAFTVIGVAVAVRYGAEPLWIWGPLAAALTGAGGGILRDIVRASADAATLRTSLYAEVAVAWGLLLSLALLVFPHEVRLGTIQAGIVITVVGVFLTRMAVVGGGIRSPSFR